MKSLVALVRAAARAMLLLTERKRLQEEQEQRQTLRERLLEMAEGAKKRRDLRLYYLGGPSSVLLLRPSKAKPLEPSLS